MKNIYFAIILLSLCPIVKASSIQTENLDEKMQQDFLLPNQAAFTRSIRIIDTESFVNNKINTWINQINKLERYFRNNSNDLINVRQMIEAANKEQESIENERLGHGIPDLIARFNRAKDKFTQIKAQYNQLIKVMQDQLAKLQV